MGKGTAVSVARVAALLLTGAGLACSQGPSPLEATVVAQATLIAGIAATASVTSTSTSTPTVTPTASPLPTSTPYPTDTPLPTDTPIPTPRPRPATATPTPTPDTRRAAFVTFLNRFQSVGNAMAGSVLVHLPRMQEGTSIIGQDYDRGFFLTTSAIDMMVKGLERVLPTLQALQAPDEFATEFRQYQQATDLFFDGLKRINFGLVRKDNAVLETALRDYLRGARSMDRTWEDLKATAAKYGISRNDATLTWE